MDLPRPSINYQFVMTSPSAALFPHLSSGQISRWEDQGWARRCSGNPRGLKLPAEGTALDITLGKAETVTAFPGELRPAHSSISVPPPLLSSGGPRGFGSPVSCSHPLEGSAGSQHREQPLPGWIAARKGAQAKQRPLCSSLLHRGQL